MNRRPGRGFNRFVLYTSLWTLLVFWTVGCGYRPASAYVSELLPPPVYVEMTLSKIEPQNGVFLKDELLRTLEDRMHLAVTDDPAKARSRMEIAGYHFQYTPLNLDDNGYVTRYRIHTTIDFVLKQEGKRIRKSVETTEDVRVQAGSLTSTTAKERAIHSSIRKAMDQFFAFVAYRGLRR